MNELSGAGIGSHRIRLYGMFGEFRIRPESPDQSVYTVKYFSTLASAKEESPAGNSRQFLKELKPVRERVKSTKIKSLSSLLQRDLSDYRVAKDLVPYLQGESDSKVGFFPAVLVALLPKGFLSEDDVEYPASSVIDELKTEYGTNWNIERYRLDDKLTALGKLTLNPSNTDVIVLDGQHRANAFRFMAGEFKDAIENTVYQPFYSGLKQPSSFSAELPVTVIWFEAEGSDVVEPMAISRRLFVDVNTNARKVEESRNILLDDSSPVCVCVTDLYSNMADRGFSTNTLSLIYSGFDSSEDTRPSIALFSPSTIRYAYSYFALGSFGWHDLGANVSRESFLEQKNYARLKKLCKGLTEAEISRFRKGDHQVLSTFRKKIGKGLSSKVMMLLERHPLVRSHIDAGSALNANLNDGDDYIARDVWQKVFQGGEGLYSAYMELDDSEGTYRNAIDALVSSFDSLRAEKCGLSTEDGGRVNKAFITLGSRAGIAGLLMSLSIYAESRSWSDETIEGFVTQLAKLSSQHWVNIFTLLKPKVDSKLEPKAWPTMMRIYLRVLQSTGPNKYYKGDTLKLSPDVKAICNDVDDKLKGWRRANPGDDPENNPDSITMKKWAEEAVSKWTEVLKSTGLKSLMSAKVAEGHALSHLESRTSIPEVSMEDE